MGRWIKKNESLGYGKPRVNGLSRSLFTQLCDAKTESPGATFHNSLQTQGFHQITEVIFLFLSVRGNISSLRVPRSYSFPNSTRHFLR